MHPSELDLDQTLFTPIPAYSFPIPTFRFPALKSVRLECLDFAMDELDNQIDDEPETVPALLRQWIDWLTDITARLCAIPSFELHNFSLNLGGISDRTAKWEAIPLFCGALLGPLRSRMAALHTVSIDFWQLRFLHKLNLKVRWEKEYEIRLLSFHLFSATPPRRKNCTPCLL